MPGQDEGNVRFSDDDGVPPDVSFKGEASSRAARLTTISSARDVNGSVPAPPRRVKGAVSWQTIVAAALFGAVLVSYFYIAFSAPPLPVRAFVFAVQTNTGYRPTHHPLYLYFGGELQRHRHQTATSLSELSTFVELPVQDEPVSSAAGRHDAVAGLDEPAQVRSGAARSTPWWMRWLGDRLPAPPSPANSIPPGIRHVDVAPLRVQLAEVHRRLGPAAKGFVSDIALERASPDATHPLRLLLRIPPAVARRALLQGAESATRSPDGSGPREFPVLSGYENERVSEGSILRSVSFSVDITRLVMPHGQRLSLAEQVSLTLFATPADRDLLEDIRVAADEILRSPPPLGNATTDGHRHSRKWASEVTYVVDPRSLLGTTRYSAKSHFIAPWQIAIDYSVAGAVVQAGLGNFPGFITANLVTVLHPFVGLAAGVCFFLAASRAARSLPESPTDLGAAHVDITSEAELTPMHSPGCSVRGREALATSQSRTSPGIAHAHSGFATTGWRESPLIACLAAVMRRTAAVGSGDGGRAREHLLVVAGCVLFYGRNWLDTLDGVLARFHKDVYGQCAALEGLPSYARMTTEGCLPAAGASNGGTRMGFNSHSLDVVMDVIGGTASLLGVWALLWRQERQLSHFWFTVLHRLPLPARARTALLGMKRMHLSRLVAFVGLAMPAATASIWEVFMLRYTSLMDPHAYANAGLYRLEGSGWIRGHWYLWALSCGDNVFLLVIAGLLTDTIWPLVQLLAFVGYAWVAVLGLWSTAIWAAVTMQDAAAVEQWQRFLATAS